MANSLLVVPFTGADDELVQWLARQASIAPPAGTGRLPSVEDVVEILEAADWPFEAYPGDDGWYAVARPRAGRWPPFSEVTLLSGSLSFRLGGLFGPFHVAREVARRRGPQVAFECSAGNGCILTADTTYDDFHLALARSPAPADGSDRRWSEPPTPDEKSSPG